MNTENKPYITVTSGMSGFFAVMMWWNPDLGGFWEPYQTGDGRYSESGHAVQEAKMWAEAEGMEYHEY